MSAPTAGMPAPGGTSPWGVIDHVVAVAPGIAFVTTPSHGGYYLAPDRLQAVDARWGCPGPWFEEDRDWAVVAFTFPDQFTAAQPSAALAHADAILRAALPDAYEAITGRSVAPGESSARDGARFIRANPEGMWCRAAHCDGYGLVPAGHVAVEAETESRAALARASGDYAARSPSVWLLLTAEQHRAAMTAHGRIAPGAFCERFPDVPATEGVSFSAAGSGIPYSPASALQHVRMPRHSDADALDALGWWRPATAALLHAKEGRFRPAVTLLAKCSASESGVIRHGVLWLASRAGDAHAVADLLEQGADPTWCEGIALEAAERHGHSGVAELLRPRPAASARMGC